MESISISEFKATCLAVLHKVHDTGQPILVTRRGVPVAEVVPPSVSAAKIKRVGALVGKGAILGDVLSPASDLEDWEVLRD